MQPILDNTVNFISIRENGELINSSCVFPFYSPDNTKIGFWMHHHDYWDGVWYRPSYYLYIRDLITDELTLVDTGNSDKVSPSYSKALFSPDSTKILFYSTSTNLIPDDTELAAYEPGTSARWFIYDLVNEGYVRAMYDVEEDYYGNLEDYREALWVDNEQIVLVSYANNLGGVHEFPEHKEVFLCNINSQTVTCLSTDPNLVDPYFISDSYRISSALDKVSFLNDTLGPCIKIISTGELIVAQNLPGINNLGTINYRFQWDSSGNKFLFRIEYGPSNVTNHSEDDFVYNMLDDTIYPLNENNIDTIAGDSFSNSPLFSPDGSKVAFLTELCNIDLASTDETLNVYTKDLSTGILTKISKTVLGSNILYDVDEFNWLSDNKIVFTTYSETLDENDNNILDWFVHDIQLNTTKRINYAPDGDLLFSENSEYGDIRRDSFNADGNTILFASREDEYNKYILFAKVFEDKTLPFPPLGTTTVSPNDAINSTVTDTTSADIYRVADTITGAPTFGIIGSQYVERANSIRYRNDIASNIRWMSLTHPNLLVSNHAIFKIGAGIFKATSTLIDDIIDVKQNAATTTTNPVIGVLTTYTIDLPYLA
jgi:hypothetical protein